jgi:hypothetical protein
MSNDQNSNESLTAIKEKELRRIARIRRAMNNPEYSEALESRPTRKMPIIIEPNSGYEVLGEHHFHNEGLFQTLHQLLKLPSRLQGYFLQFNCDDDGECVLSVNQDHLSVILKDELDLPVVAYLLNEDHTNPVYAERRYKHDIAFWIVTQQLALLNTGRWGEQDSLELQYFDSALEAQRAFEQS